MSDRLFEKKYRKKFGGTNNSSYLCTHNTKQGRLAQLV